MSIQEDPPDDLAPDEGGEPEPPQESIEFTVGARRVPEDDPADRVQRRYLEAHDPERAPLLVTVAGGDVASDYAPAAFVGRMTEVISELLQRLSGGHPPMFYGAFAGASMTLIFGDPRPEGPELRITVEAIRDSAVRVSRLIELEGDPLLASALQLGDAALSYVKLAHLVENEGVTLGWRPRGEPGRILRPSRATEQRRRLEEPPPYTERTMTVNGFLYRVITDVEGAPKGTLGLRLFRWSQLPPGQKSRTLIADYKGAAITRAINGQGLIGRPVEAVLRIRHARPGASIVPNWMERLFISLKEGPPEEAQLGRLPFDVEPIEDDELG